MRIGMIRFIRRLAIAALIIAAIILLWPLFEQLFGQYAWFRELSNVLSKIYDFIFRGGVIARAKILWRSIQKLF